MTKTSDVLYGRAGGRFVAPAAVVLGVEVLPTPTAKSLRSHLLNDHAMPAAVLDAHASAAHAMWHAAEHRTRDPKPDATSPRHAGHLRHTHPDVHPDKPEQAA